MHVDQLPDAWSRTRGLTVFVRPPTTLSALVHEGNRYTVPSNATVAIELAFLRSRSSRAAPQSRCTFALAAEWRGPAASTRPRSLCVSTYGISGGGRLYPLSPTVTAMLRRPS